MRRGLLILALLAAGGAPSAATASDARHPREFTLLERQWGVQIEYVRQTAAGYMLEFRYKVVDPAKAAPLFDRALHPMLTHVESGGHYVVPTPAKTGPLRNSDAPLPGHVYWMFFANPGRVVSPGDHVNIEIGAFRVDGLVVE